MKYRIIYLDAFTTKPFSGNPCAVLPEAEGLSEKQMQQIARETNLSETAFVFPSLNAQVRVRYFMPHKEIPFAGHPTIATAFMLALEGILPLKHGVNTIDFEFNIGVLPVEVHGDDEGRPIRAVMTQQPPVFGATASIQEITPGVGLPAEAVMENIPLQVVNTGIPFLIVPLRDRSFLEKARMNAGRLAAALTPLGLEAAYLLSPGGQDPQTDFSGRLFAPENVAEDPFTGSAVGCAGAFAVQHGLSSNPILHMAQGHLLGRPGYGTVTIEGSPDKITGIKVGGAAVKTLDGYIYTGEH